MALVATSGACLIVREATILSSDPRGGQVSRTFRRPPANAPQHAGHATPYALARAMPPSPSHRWSLTPGARGVAEHVALSAPLAFEWDFEPGVDGATALSGWTSRGGAAIASPACENLDPSRLPGNGGLVTEIGGDYWDHTFWPGNSGRCFVDTQDKVVTLVSPPIALGPQTRHISFLIGGGGDGGRVWLEVEGRPSGPAGSPWVDDGPGWLGMVRRDHVVPDALFGRKAHLVVEGRGGSGVLVDDVAGSADDLGWSQPDGPVWGTVDLHNHVFNHLTFGGRLLSGRVTESPLSADTKAGVRAGPGVARALEDCEPHHGQYIAYPSDRALSLTAEFYHPRGGYPTFEGWRKSTTSMHEQTYVDWLRRAWRGGLRLIHLDAGNSAFAGVIFERANFWMQGNVFPLDDTSAVERTLDAVQEFVAGEGRGWTEVATSAAEARRIVREGKLALVLGVEVDSLNDYFSTCPKERHYHAELGDRLCNQFPDDEQATIHTLQGILDHLYARGVRHLIPIHVIENAYGYPATYGRQFDVNSEWANDGAYPLINGWDSHVRFRLDDDQVNGSSLLTWAISVVGDVRSGFPPGRVAGGPFPNGIVGHMAAQGLKRPGRFLLAEMMKRGMIIDLQHMGELATNESIAMAKRADYPLTVTHTGFRELAFGYSAKVGWDPARPAAVVEAYDTAQLERIPSDALKSPDQIEAVRDLGGMVGVGLTTTSVAVSWDRPNDDFCDDTSVTWASSYNYAFDRLGGRGLGLGSDVNGLAQLPDPRFGTHACLGANGDDYRAPLMGGMAAKQRNGVRYEVDPGRMGVSDAGASRFANSDSGYAYSAAERDIWEGLAEAEVTRKEATPKSAFHAIVSYDPRAPFRVPREAGIVERFAKGFWAKQHGVGAEVLDACFEDCDDYDNCSRPCAGKDPREQAAYDAWPPVPAVSSAPGDTLLAAETVVEAWRNMQGTNRPIHKYVMHGKDFWGRPIDRDFDVNLEGMAHYGLLPDFLQDVKNVGMDEEHLARLFMGAEDYIEMWERAERRAPELVSKDDRSF
jgi:microsomal dipeptidase-like Zn-dependent dipeptidase